MPYQWTSHGEQWVERDDDPGLVVPEGVKPGERFILSAPHGRADVYDWEDLVCERCKPTPDCPPLPECFCCDGTGVAGMGPVLVYSDLDPIDARLLTYGPALLAAVSEILPLLRDRFDGTKEQAKLDVLDAAVNRIQ